ncbi:MAG: AEC family transporter [Eubacteriales bacterium]|jgi:predicted permease
MADFLFSLNTVLPMFLLLLLGYALRQKGILDPATTGKLNTLVFYVALPASIFYDTALTDFTEEFDIRFVLFTTGATAVSFLLAWGIARAVHMRREQLSAFVHGAFRGNYIYMGTALAKNIMGTDHLPLSQLIVAFVIPLYNILAVILFSVAGNGQKLTFKKMVRDILTNPMIVAILAALPFALLHIPLPFAASKTLSYCGNLATPMALLIIGANFDLGNLAGNWKKAGLATFHKLVLQPALAVPLAYMMHFSTEAMVLIMVLLAVPSAANSYIMTRSMGGDAELGSSIVVTTTLCSLLTMTLWIFGFKRMGII